MMKWVLTVQVAKAKSVFFHMFVSRFWSTVYRVREAVESGSPSDIVPFCWRFKSHLFCVRPKSRQHYHSRPARYSASPALKPPCLNTPSPNCRASADSRQRLRSLSYPTTRSRVRSRTTSFRWIKVVLPWCPFGGWEYSRDEETSTSAGSTGTSEAGGGRRDEIAPSFGAQEWENFAVAQKGAVWMEGYVQGDHAVRRRLWRRVTTA